MKIVSAALAMLGMAGAAEIPIPPLSKVTPKIIPYHFVTTATDTNGLTSEFSNEAIWNNTNNQRYVTLAWDRSPSDTQITNYIVYSWRTGGNRTNSTSAGPALRLTVDLFYPPLTNRILYVTSVNATNIRYRPYGGLWNLCGWTNRTLTNPPVGLQYQGMGRSSKSPARVMIYKEVR